jgi:hypothetical protein
MKNMKYKAADAAGLVFALPVPADAMNGRPVKLGEAGLFGILMTDRVTPALRAAGKAPQGLKDGQASVLLPGIGSAVDYGPLGAEIGLFFPVHVDAAGMVYPEASDATVTVGYRLPGDLVAVRSNY